MGDLFVVIFIYLIQFFCSLLLFILRQPDTDRQGGKSAYSVSLLYLLEMFLPEHMYHSLARSMSIIFFVCSD